MQDQALPLTRALPVRQNLPSPYPPIFPSPTLADARTCTRTQFENLISRTIDETKDIPEIISETGKIDMSHKEIMQKIGELFLLRTNINSVGSVLDSPEVFWVRAPFAVRLAPCPLLLPSFLDVLTHLSPRTRQTYPDLQPLYDAARAYLELPQRLDLLNARVEVLQDMLQLLKETVTSRHAERLEQIVIALIAVEIGACPSLHSSLPFFVVSLLPWGCVAAVLALALLGVQEREEEGVQEKKTLTFLRFLHSTRHHHHPGRPLLVGADEDTSRRLARYAARAASAHTSVSTYPHARCYEPRRTYIRTILDTTHIIDYLPHTLDWSCSNRLLGLTQSKD